MTSKAVDAEYKNVGAHGKAIGLFWGGDWSNPDYPHFQMRDNNELVSIPRRLHGRTTHCLSGTRFSWRVAHPSRVGAALAERELRGGRDQLETGDVPPREFRSERVGHKEQPRCEEQGEQVVPRMHAQRNFLCAAGPDARVAKGR